MRALAVALMLAACAPPAAETPADPRCGDGIRQGHEECDKGDQNGHNTGCETDCTLSCVPLDPQRGDSHCDPHDPCKGTGKCGDDFICHVSGGLADGASCGNGNVCKNGACQAPVCGDGILSAGEECDDGVLDGSNGCGPGCKFVCVSTDPTRDCAATACQGASTCNDSTHLCGARTDVADGTSCGSNLVCQSGQCVPYVAPVCGNGVREGSEQCDDGNTTNLDGCDSSCHFEQDVRANSVTMQWGTDAFCTVNKLGAAIGSSAQSTLQGQLTAAVKGGSLTMAFRVLGLHDLTGTNDTGLTLGAVTGTPATPAPSHTYDGNADLDWWYAVPASNLDAQRVPLAQLPSGKIVSKTLTAGPGKMTMNITLGGGPVALAASSVRLRASVGNATAPGVSAGATPGHTYEENLDPALTSFASLTNGELCGNASAASLAAVPAPQSVQSGGSVACDEGFTSSNTTLDVIVAGCTVYGFITAVAATQPDQVDASAPAAGAGGPYKFVLSGTHVTGCKDKNGATADLTKCLGAAAFSTFLTFTADRVILK